MILCRDFTFIHMPKNAGSFVETVLRKIFCTTPRPLAGLVDRWDRHITNRVLNRKPHCYATIGWQLLLKGYAEILVHGFASEAPANRLMRPMLTVLRDPLDRSISEFEFRWWEWSGAKHPNEEKIRRVYPEWPYISSFRDYVFLRDEFHTRFQEAVPARNRVGIQTETFIRFFCRNPHEILAGGADSLSMDRVLCNLFDIHFLNMDFLNLELAAYLRGQGVSDAAAQRAERHDRVLPENRGRAEHKNYAAYYDDELLEHVRSKEAIVLAIWEMVSKGCRTSADLKRCAGL
jgi:hypothetical protein